MTSISTEEYAQLRSLEESLWRAESRFDRRLMEQTLAPDFFEFGRSGRVHKREHTLTVPAQSINAKLPLPNFDARLITADVALVTYVSEVTYSCVSAWNKDPVSGVIGVQTGPH
jgi:hypothetical protein